MVHHEIQMDPSMTMDHKRSSSLSIPIDPPSPKRQRIDPPSSKVIQALSEHAELLDNTTTTTTPDSRTSQSTSPAPSDRPVGRSSKQFKPKGPRIVTTDTIIPLREPYKVQGICQSHHKKQKEFPMCIACIVRQFDSGGCKFASIRAFPIDDTTGRYIPASFPKPMFLDSAPFLGRNQREATRDSAITYSTAGTTQDIDFIKSCIAPTLKVVLAIEMANEMTFRDRGLLRRRREAGVRPICDGCATTIFSGHFMCCCCGREICLDCYVEWDDELDKGWERVDSCSKRKRHTKRQMVPFTFFRRGELEALIKDVDGFISMESEMTEGQGRKFQEDKTEGFLPFVKTSVQDIEEEAFKHLWGLGKPIVLTNCLERFNMSWTPDHFIEKYRTVKCHLVNCQTDKTMQSTVGKFFQDFLSPDTTRPLKLKDWPPADDFAEIFPDLFSDFENALPFPRYTRRKGFMNLAARFPEDLVTPDLGPKMYNAYASDDGINGQGTTKLHLDITDAVNIMTFAAPNETVSSRGGAAVWDIFPADATEILRAFLRSSNPTIDDPVMRQTFYITTPQLSQLRDEYNVVPWRIYQNPGEAVFIPAGCAHQVCNLTSCIKVACDFVSPHGIRRCRELIDGTRRLAGVKGGKREDVLQLKTMLMCAWEEMGRWTPQEDRTSDQKEAAVSRTE